jgi:hypothetical protein
MPEVHSAWPLMGLQFSRTCGQKRRELKRRCFWIILRVRALRWKCECLRLSGILEPLEPAPRNWSQNWSLFEPQRLILRRFVVLQFELQCFVVLQLKPLQFVVLPARATGLLYYSL